MLKQMELGRARVGLLALTALGISLVGSAISTAQEQESTRQTLQRLDLVDQTGKKWQLDEVANKPVVVIAFLGVECPLAKLYAARLNELQQQVGDQVAILGVDANPQDAPSEIAAFAKRQQLTYPLLRDSQQDVLAQLQAARTPEVFVLDRQRHVCYQGRIDDQYGVGYVRSSPEKQFLRMPLGKFWLANP